MFFEIESFKINQIIPSNSLKASVIKKLSSLLPGLAAALIPIFLPIIHIFVLWYFWHAYARWAFNTSHYIRYDNKIFFIKGSLTKDFVRARVGTRFLKLLTNPALLRIKIFTLTQLQTQCKYGCWQSHSSYHFMKRWNISWNSSYRNN